jgi:DNA-binding MarR family transcriptional regulator
LIRVLKTSRPTQAAYTKPLVNMNLPTGQHANAKINMQQAREIRDAHAAGQASMRELAEEYGISKACISHIVNNQSYKEVVRVSQTRVC